MPGCPRRKQAYRVHRLIVQSGLQHYRLGVPQPGVYRERINTDSAHGGSNFGMPYGDITAQPVDAHARPRSIEFALPPLATVFFTWNEETA